MDNKDTRKLVIYGANFVPSLLSNFGNPYGAIFFGVENIIEKIYQKAGDNLPMRLIKTTGAVFYAGVAVVNLIGIVHNLNITDLIDTILAGSMAIELAVENRDAYNRCGTDIKQDIETVINTFK